MKIKLTITLRKTEGPTVEQSEIEELLVQEIETLDLSYDDTIYEITDIDTA